MATLFFLLRHALWTALLAATAWAAAKLVLRRWAGQVPMALSLAVGLAVLGQALLILGLLAGLRPLPILVMAGAMHALAARDWRGDWRLRAAGWRSRVPAARSPAVWTGVGLGVFALLLWALALYPPVAFDEILYHLPFTRAFAETGALPNLPDLRMPVFPPLVELLGVPLYLFGDDVDTHAVSWLATLAVAGILLAWGRLVADARTGALAAAFWLGAPIVVYLSGVGYVEPVLALFVAGALYAQARSEHAAGRAGWQVLTGVLAGSAAAVKYHGLFFVAAFAVAYVAATRGDLRARLRATSFYGGGALIALLPTYARIVAHTGNPLFPFYPRLFGSTPWTPLTELAPAAGDDWWAFAMLPWRLVFERSSIGGMPPHSPLLLLALPLALVGAVRVPRARWPLLLAVAYAVLSPQDARYLIPAMPALALAAAASTKLWPRAPMRTLVVLALLPGLLYALYSFGRRGPLPTTLAAREEYIERWLPLYPAVRFLNQLRPDGYTAYGLLAEQMVYPARGRWLGDWSGPGSFQRILPLLADSGALYRTLRSLEVEYLVVPRARIALPAAVRADSRFQPIYSDVLADVYALEPGAAQSPATLAPATP